MNQTSHRRLGICFLISVLGLHRGILLLRCRDECQFTFMEFLDADVRQRHDKILIDPLTALEFVSITRCSTEILQSFVAETIAASSFSGTSWAQMYLREMAGQESIRISHRRLGICRHNFILHRGILLRRRHDPQFVFWQYLDAVVKKFAACNAILHFANLRFRLPNFKFPRNQERAPRETSGRHSCQQPAMRRDVKYHSLVQPHVPLVISLVSNSSTSGEVKFFNGRAQR